MAKTGTPRKRRKVQTKHRLLIYDRLSKRWRGAPLFTALMGVLLYALVQYGFAPDFLEYQPLVLVLIIVNAMLFVLLLYVGGSYVEARAAALYIRAGFVGMNISYRRVTSIFPISLEQHYPPDRLKRWERGLVEPFLKISSTAVELRGFPMDERWLRRLWSKFLFTTKQKGIILTVRNPLLLNQQLDHHRDRFLEHLEKRRKKEPEDLVDRILSRRQQ
jgi:hypothetical protein